MYTLYGLLALNNGKDFPHCNYSVANYAQAGKIDACMLVFYAFISLRAFGVES